MDFPCFRLIFLLLILIFVVSSEDGSEDKKEKPRMITKEELAKHNGTDENKTMWLSIMSEVYDVSSAPHFYGENASYSIFVGRDANVPFITGNFTKEEAAKSITTLTSKQLYNLKGFKETYDGKNSKYPFVGLLVGELYDADGNPTKLYEELKKEIKIAQIEAEEHKARRKKIIEDRKKKAAAAKGSKDTKPRPVVKKKTKSDKEL